MNNGGEVLSQSSELVDGSNEMRLEARNALVPSMGAIHSDGARSINRGKSNLKRLPTLLILALLLASCTSTSSTPSQEVVASATQITYPTETSTAIPSPTATEAPTEVPPTPTEVPKTAEDLMNHTVDVVTSLGIVTMPDVENINEALMIVAAYGTEWNEFHAGDVGTPEDWKQTKKNKLMSKWLGSFNVQVTGDKDQYIKIHLGSKEPGTSIVYYIREDSVINFE